MDFKHISDIFQLLTNAVVICTSLLFGFSFVDITLKPILKTLSVSSIFVSFLSILLFSELPDAFSLLAIYFTIMVICFFYLQVSKKQLIIAILLALTFNLTVIQLFAYNIFNIGLLISNVPADPVIDISFAIFILLTNVFISINIYIKEPVFFPNRWFYSHTQYGAERNTFGFQVIFLVFILIAFDSFLFYTFAELHYFRLTYRLFIIGWMVVFSMMFLFFTKRLVLYHLERVDISIDKSYQKDILSFYQVIRSQRHDFNIHMNTIYGLLKVGKFKETEHYIDEVVEEVKDINELLPLFHPAIGSMIFTYREMTLQKGIDLYVDIKDDLRYIPCGVYEMNKIIGNLLQNAIEAVDSGQIKLEITNESNVIVVRVTNKIDLHTIAIEDMFQHGFSTKETHEGIGLPAIQHILSKYNGVIYPEIEGNHLTMVVRIPINQ